MPFAAPHSVCRVCGNPLDAPAGSVCADCVALSQVGRPASAASAPPASVSSAPTPPASVAPASVVSSPSAESSVAASEPTLVPLEPASDPARDVAVGTVRGRPPDSDPAADADARPIRRSLEAFPGTEPRVGDVVGHFRLIGELGRGGMGVVWRAEDTGLHRQVALKILPAWALAEGPVALERFLLEARAAARLEHPNIVAVHEIGCDRGRHFIALQLLNGGSAEDLVRKCGPLPPGLATRIIADAARGLAAAHAAGVIHRDIKPANILLAVESEKWNADGDSGSAPTAALRFPLVSAKLADFGLAKFAGGESNLTVGGVVVGTPTYMSPEQAQGLTVEARSDQYSLGAAYARLLLGRPVFVGDSSMQVMYMHCREPLPDPAQLGVAVPDGAWAVVRRAMEKDPGHRFAATADMAAALESLAADLVGAGGDPLPQARPAAAAAKPVESRPALSIEPLPILMAESAPREPMSASPARGPVVVFAAAGLAAVAAATVFLRGGWTPEVEPGPGPGSSSASATEPGPGRSPAPTVPKPNAPDGPNPKTAPSAGAGPVMFPLDFREARAAQRGWAARLGVEPEITNSIGMRLVLLPPGRFRAGSPADEPGRGIGEDLTDAVIPAPLRTGAFEVTRGQFHAVMGGRRPADADEAAMPAVGMGFALAESFCRKLSELPAEKAAGRVYRLPTGAEWEYACRAGSERPFAWSIELSGWDRTNSADRAKPWPAGRKQPNAWGVYDAHGNAAEWVSDAAGDGSPRRFVRGGSWLSPTPECRAAARRLIDPASPSELRSVGLRVVCEGGLRR